MNESKDVALITILDNTNFGTYLQALALCETIKKFGFNPIVIKYFRPSMTSKGYFKGLVRQFGLLRAIVRRLASNQKEAWDLREEDYKFLENFVPVTQRYANFEELKQNPPEADIYITGSDQVWNSFYNNGIDKSFFLDFAPSGKKKIAYAASIGMADFPANEVKQTVALLKNYFRITVRENSAKKILNRYGIICENVLDPTLLLDEKDWLEISNKFPSSEEYPPYLLVYSVETKNQNAILAKYARLIAGKKNLKIYFISYSRHTMGFDGADKYFLSATPELFLRLMLNASFVLVSSFHGTAFAINFQKQFFTVAPNMFNSRVGDLLDLTRLKDRLIRDGNSELDFNAEIDYNGISEIISHQRSYSMLRLKEMLI